MRVDRLAVNKTTTAFFLLVLFMNFYRPVLAIAGSITGKIIEKESRSPLEFVNVFLANTTRGTTTDEKGVYAIRNVPPGIYQLVISRIGYRVETVQVRMAGPVVKRYDFELRRTVIAGEQVTIEAPDDPEWRQNFKKFRTLFIGESSNANRCRITNPYHLDFTPDSAGYFIARSSKPLLIENNALGYDIRIILNLFRWGIHGGIYAYYPYFTEKQPKNNRQAHRWRNMRKKTYRGSLRHFLSELAVRNTTGYAFPFDLYHAVRTGSTIDVKHDQPLVVESLLISEQDPAIGSVRFYYGAGFLAVRDREGGEMSYIRFLKGYLDFDRYGNILNARDFEVSGHWGTQRLADTLPNDYRENIE